MSLTVVGSVAFDALETPFGKREKILGVRRRIFRLSASFFTRVNAVGVVGGDFGEAEWDVFRRHAINTDDVEVVAGRQDVLLERPLRLRHEHGPHARHAVECV